MSGKRGGSGKKILPKKQIRAIQRRLEERKAKLVKILRLEVGSSGGEPEAIDNCQKELQVSLSLKDRERLAMEFQAIEAALKRINSQTFGICYDCQEPISRARLESLPTAIRCIECQGEFEEKARRKGFSYGRIVALKAGS